MYAMCAGGWVCDCTSSLSMAPSTTVVLLLWRSSPHFHLHSSHPVSTTASYGMAWMGMDISKKWKLLPRCRLFRAAAAAVAATAATSSIPSLSLPSSSSLHHRSPRRRSRPARTTTTTTTSMGVLVLLLALALHPSFVVRIPIILNVCLPLLSVNVVAAVIVYTVYTYIGTCRLRMMCTYT